MEVARSFAAIDSSYAPAVRARGLLWQLQVVALLKVCMYICTCMYAHNIVYCVILLLVYFNRRSTGYLTLSISIMC